VRHVHAAPGEDFDIVVRNVHQVRGDGRALKKPDLVEILNRRDAVALDAAILRRMAALPNTTVLPPIMRKTYSIL
jgi:hypothetical protein